MKYPAKSVMLMNPSYKGLLGRGKFDVYKCHVGGEFKALKLLAHCGSKDEIETVKTSLRNEVVGLFKADPSPNVVNLAGLVEYEYFTGIIMEYMPRGNLADFVKKCKPSFLLRLKLLHDVAVGISHLHHNLSPVEAISHNDLKPQNVVLNADFTAKICDFDGSDVIPRTSGLAHYQVSRTISAFTENYAAPELLEIIQRDGKTIERKRSMDVYSFSMIMYYMLTGNHPFGELESERVIAKYLNSERPPITPELTIANDDRLLPQGLQDLMTRCWGHDPNTRPKIQDITAELDGYLTEDRRQRISEEIYNMKEANPIPQEDSSDYSDTFEAFCHRYHQPVIQDNPGTVDLMEVQSSVARPRATVSEMNCILQVERLDNLNQGDRILIRSSDKTVECQVLRVDNISPYS